MESEEVLLNGGTSNGYIVKYVNGLGQVNGGNGMEQVGSDGVGKGSLADEVLEDLEEYWEDINDRLMISRMVGDSVIKGMVTAVEQEAEEKIRTKELEVADLKEQIRSSEVGDIRNEPVRLTMDSEPCGIGNTGRVMGFTDIVVEHEKMKTNLYAFRNEARQHFEKAKKEIDCGRGINCNKKIGSGSDLVGLGGILQEKQCESWLHLDKVLEDMRSTMETFCNKTNCSLLSSKTFLCELQHELDLLRNVEVIVIQSVLKSVQEEFEEKLCERNAQYHYVNWLDKVNDISSLRGQLDLIVKSLPIPEAGLSAHGSHDLDHLHQPSNHVKVANSPEKENGTSEPSDLYDFLQLKHLNGEEMVNYFNNIITRMKRDHESALQEKTEMYYRLRGEYLKEKGSLVTHKKDEDSDVLRRKIPEIISKLDDFLVESEKFPKLLVDIENLGKLNKRVDDLVSENRKLRDCLTDKKKEMEGLEAQVSDATRELLNHSLVEENMRQIVADLSSAVDDSHIEVSLNEEVYMCVLRELIGRKRCDSNDDSEVKFHDVTVRAAAISAETMDTNDVEDSDFESLIFQDLSALIFREAITDADKKLNNLHHQALNEEENRISLETIIVEKENELKGEVEENKRLKQEILCLQAGMQQKEKLVEDLSVSLSKERHQYDLTSNELSSLRENLTQQQSLVAQINGESESLRASLSEATEQIERDQGIIQGLDKHLGEIKKTLAETDKERNKAFALAQERFDRLLICEAREEKITKELELAIYGINGLSKLIENFDFRVSGAIEKNNLRLEDTSSQLTTLTNLASVLTKKELACKLKLERSCADLKMAEAEVDLLGDEVDALLRLMEKIYIALDHYSPILKHYPGIMEILELVRRELSGESTKLSQSTPWRG